MTACLFHNVFDRLALGIDFRAMRKCERTPARWRTVLGAGRCGLHMCSVRAPPACLAWHADRGSCAGPASASFLRRLVVSLSAPASARALLSPSASAHGLLGLCACKLSVSLQSFRHASADFQRRTPLEVSSIEWCLSHSAVLEGFFVACEGFSTALGPLLHFCGSRSHLSRCACPNLLIEQLCLKRQ